MKSRRVAEYRTAARMSGPYPDVRRPKGTSVAPLSLLFAALAVLSLAMVPSAQARPASEIAGAADRTPGGWRTRTGSQRRLRSPGGRNPLGPSGPARPLDRSPRGPSLASGRADWSEMDAIVAAAHRALHKAAPHCRLRPSLGQRRERSAGLPRHTWRLSRTSSKPPCAAIPDLRLGALERAQLRCLRQATARSGWIVAFLRSATSGARTGGVRRQAHSGGLARGRVDRHCRLGSRRERPLGGPRSRRRAGPI